MSAGDLKYLLALGVPVANIAHRIGRTELAVTEEIYRHDQEEEES